MHWVFSYATFPRCCKRRALMGSRIVRLPSGRIVCARPTLTSIDDSSRTQLLQPGANARFLFRFRGSGSTPWTFSSLALAQVRLISCNAARARDAQQPMRVFDIPAVKALGPGQHAQRVRDATGLHGSDRHFCAKSNEGLFQVCGSVECGWLCDGDGRWPSVVRHIATGPLRLAGVTFTPNPRRLWSQ